jgi:hypothetical protein
MVKKLLVAGFIAVACTPTSGCARDTIDAVTGESDGYGDIRPQVRVSDLKSAGFSDPAFTGTKQDLEGNNLPFSVRYGTCIVGLDTDPFIFTYHRKEGSVDKPIIISVPDDLKKIPELKEC